MILHSEAPRCLYDEIKYYIGKVQVQTFAQQQSSTLVSHKVGKYLEILEMEPEGL